MPTRFSLLRVSCGDAVSHLNCRSDGPWKSYGLLRNNH